MISRKYIVVSLMALITAAVSLNALPYFAGKPSAKGDEKKLKWSTCEWYGEPNYDTKPLPGKPSTGDDAVLHWSYYYLDVDSDVNVTNLIVGAASHMFCDGKNIKLKRNLSTAITSGWGSVSTIHLKNTRVEMGGSLEVGFWTHSMGAGLARIIFENTKLAAKSGFNMTIPYNGRFKNKERAGTEVIFKGNSNISFGGGAIVDSLINESPKEWFLKFKFEGENGAFPTVSFDKESDFTGIDIDVTLDKTAKVGKYTLMELKNRKSKISPRAITLNGKKYNLGESVKIGERNVVVSVEGAPNSKDVKTKNDLVITVK